jgi:hypothetical protein
MTIGFSRRTLLCGVRYLDIGADNHIHYRISVLAQDAVTMWEGRHSVEEGS